MNWKLDYLIMGFIVENIIILVAGLDGQIAGRWYFLILTPLGIWGLELLKNYTQNSNNITRRRRR